MFSGIVETTTRIRNVEPHESVVRVTVDKPDFFHDLKIGDSIACNGVCLTVEKISDATIQFALVEETLKMIGVSSAESLINQTWNLERSLRFGDRVHGHLVTGHVEAQGTVTRSQNDGEAWFVDVQIPDSIAPYLWKKGSISMQGVSLTIHEFVNQTFSVCLIPETIKRTNLAELKVGQKVNIETDYLAKAYFQSRQHEL